MGSHNSEHSGSMNSDEFTNFIGNNYAAPLPQLERSINSEDVMGEPLSPRTQQRMQEQIQLILNDGTELNATGPTEEASSKASHGSPPNKVQSPAEISSDLRIEGTQVIPGLNHSTSNVNTGGSEQGKKTVTWSSLVLTQKQTGSKIPQIEVTYNEDGSANVFPPRDFLLNAQKRWDARLIGHFIGGSHSFKFVKEQALKLWSNMGLTRVFYSSKGYFTFCFNTVEEKDKILNLRSIQIGGKTMYIIPWMEGSTFKRNVIDSVPVWIRFVDLPQSYWSREALSIIAKAVGTPLKFDEATSRFEPLKYANIQVDLKYTSPRPNHVWIKVVNRLGIEEKEKIEIQYSQVPYSLAVFVRLLDIRFQGVAITRKQ